MMKGNEIIEALKRSGYLFESSISEYFSLNDYFVENNTIIIDPLTGKNREIDIVTHKNDINKDYTNKIYSLVTLVIELKNNLYPVVLLTKFQINPNSDTDILYEYIAIPEDSDYQSITPFYSFLVLNVSDKIFTQYCSFHKKNNKDEIMAIHPDELYQGINKIVHYCEQFPPWWYTNNDDHFESFPEKS